MFRPLSLALSLFFVSSGGMAQSANLKGSVTTVASFRALTIKRLAADSTGAIVLSGTTTSAGLPTTPNAIQSDYRSTSCFLALPPGNRPCTDSYVAKISRDGALIYGSYFGGSCDDSLTTMALDETDSIYLLGNTCSTDFPYTQPEAAANPSRSYLVKIAPDGTLSFSVALPPGVTGNQIRAAGGGDIAVGGECDVNSLPWSAQFLTPNAKPKRGACYVRLASNGTDIEAATLLGASLEALATDLVLDASGNVYLAGRTFPREFPTVDRSWVNSIPQSFYNFSVFAAWVSRDGTTLFGSSMFNGEGYDDDPKIAIAPTGEVVVAGTTDSSHFPVTPGAFQTVRMGEVYDHNLYIVKLAPDLSEPVFSTYLTGEGTDYVESLSANADGSVTLVGETHSTLFPTTPDGQERCLTANYYPTYQPYLAQLASDGTSLVYSSFLNQGPTGAFVRAVASDPGSTVVATSSGDILALDPSQPPAHPLFCAMNAADFQGVGITPGEILTIFGAGLAGSQILISGLPATVLYSSDNQVNAIVPDELGSGAASTIAALRGDAIIDQTSLPVVNSVAGLFRDFGTPMVTANNDDGSLIDEAHPAQPGTIIRVFGTGFGATHPRIRIGPVIAAPVSQRQAAGVMEFRVLVPALPAGQNQAMIDFSIDGIFFPGTGLKLPLAPAQ